MSDETPREPKLWEQMFPGLGVGLLVGLLVGLSVSPVVAGVLTTLGGLLAAILGIQPNGESGASRYQVNGARIGAFGFACVLGVVSGMIIRVRDVFSVPVHKQMTTWLEAGFDAKEAKQIVAYKKTDLLLKQDGSGVAEVVAGDPHKSQSSVLFSALSDVDLCEKVKLEKFGSDPKASAKEMLTYYRGLNINDAADKRTPLYKQMGQIAERVEKLPAESQFEVLKSVEEMVCAIQEIE